MGVFNHSSNHMPITLENSGLVMFKGSRGYVCEKGFFPSG